MVTRDEYIDNLREINELDDKIRDYINDFKDDEDEDTAFLPEVLVQRKEIHRNMKRQMRSFDIKDKIMLMFKYIEYKCETYKIHHEINRYILRKYNLK